MPNVLALQNLSRDATWDSNDVTHGESSCSCNSCSIYLMDGFAG
jgi:hypothetical protein